MNEYWVMYESMSDYELIVVSLATEGEVTAFIEEKINKYKYVYQVEDFRIMKGTELSLKPIYTPIKVLLQVDHENTNYTKQNTIPASRTCQGI